MDFIDGIIKKSSNKGLMKYLTNTSWVLAEKILRMTLGLFVGIWVARYLGPEQFGLFSYAQSLVFIFSAFATLGLDGIVVRELLKNEGERDKILGTAFTLKFIGALFTIILLATAVCFQSDNHQNNFLVFIIASATVFQSFNVIDFYFQSRVLSKYVVFSNAFSLLLSSIIKVILIINEAPLISFAYVVLFDSVILASGFVYFYFVSQLSLFTWSFERSWALNLLRYSWPLILSSLVVSMYMKIDQVMIKELLGISEVGQYAAAVRLSEVWYFIPVVISASLFPAILNAKQKSSDLYYNRMQKLYDFMVWLAIAIAIPMTFLSGWGVDVLYGSEFNQTAGVLMIHIWSAVFVFLGVASSKWFIAEGLQRYTLYRTLVGAILNVVLNLALIPTQGIYGAAIATLISQFVASFFFNLFNKKTRVTFRLHSNALFLPLRNFGVKF